MIKKRGLSSLGEASIFAGVVILITLLLTITAVSISPAPEKAGNSIFDILNPIKEANIQEVKFQESDEKFLESKERVYKNDVLLLQFKEGLNGDKQRSQRQQVYNRYGLKEVKNIEGVVRVVSVPSQAIERVEIALSKNPMISFVEKDYLLETVEVPNDPRWNDGYYVQKMEYLSAWNISTGVNEVIVANPDTGIDMDHPDLIGVLIPELAYNSVTGTNIVDDVQGHGTKTAGSIGADTDNGVGIASASWQKKIIPLKISELSDGSAYVSDMAEAIRYAADNGAKVISLSYGGSCMSTISSAGSYVRSTGGLLFTSAGNSNEYTCGGQDLEEDPNLIMVSATSSSDSKTSWSNYGPDVDLAAPGAGVLTTTNGGGYGSVSGTSFSSPLVASVAALLYSAYPSATNIEIENALFSGADDLGEVGRDDIYGHGRVNAFNSMALMGQPINDTTAPLVSINNPFNGATISSDTVISIGATDQYGINKVELYINDVLYGTHFGDQSSYDYFWDISEYNNGAYTLLAKAYDNYGNNEEKSISITLEVDITPPTVSITYPSEGEKISDKFLQVTTDTTNTESVDFYLNGEFVETVSTSPFTMNKVNTRNYQGQSVTVLAQSHAPNGLTAEDSVTFSVSGSQKGGGGSDDGGGKGGSKPECSDGIDNDGDGLVDYCKNSRATGCDLQCSSRDDNSEEN